jgi:hypothetical protein
MGLIGTSLGVVQQVVGASSFVNSTQTVFGNGAQFTLATNGSLSYSTTATAPIPEADTSAMMLVGLGLMGFIARRRNRNQA